MEVVLSSQVSSLLPLRPPVRFTTEVTPNANVAIRHTFVADQH
jgi:hypothetical protein